MTNTFLLSTLWAGLSRGGWSLLPMAPAGVAQLGNTCRWLSLVAGEVGAGARLGWGLAVLLLLYVGLSLPAAWWLGSQRAGPESPGTSSDWHFPDTGLELHSVTSTTACGSPRDLWSLWEGDGDSRRSDGRSVRVTSQLEHVGPEIGLQGLGRDNLPHQKIWVSS